nr:hypothetical protein BaRGS_009771 [Batillaria attramentaria]
MLYLWHPRLPTVLLLLVTSLIFTGLCADRDGEGVRREETELHRAARQANTVNQLELLIVYDKPVYDKFLARNNNNAALAEAEIDRYFAGIVKEVNERYAKLDSGTGFSLRVILTDVIRNDVTEGLVNNGEVNSDTLLTTFRSTDLESIEPNFPHDLAVLVSGRGVFA